MTVHVRTQLRNAVKARLEASDAFARVVGSLNLQRVFQEEEFPAAAVSVTENVTVEDRNQPGHRPVRRDFMVRVNLALLLASSDDLDLDADLDALAVTTEQALADPEGFGIGAVASWEPVGTGEPDGQFAAMGLATIPLTYRCSVLTTDGDPTTNLY